MEVLDERNGRVILKRKDGALFFIDDEGFEVKKIPGFPNQIKTTEWDDWLVMNTIINEISKGAPKRRS